MQKPRRLLMRLKEDENGMLEKISRLMQGMEDLLIAKNQRYGNSALDPVNVFSDLPPGKALLVRLDDKLKRIKNSPAGQPLRKNDLADIIGYIALLMIGFGYDDVSDLID
jgi:hypothetical protein